MRDYIELVKALMCCVDGSCEGCPRLQTPEGEFDCRNKLKTDADDAIEELVAMRNVLKSRLAQLEKAEYESGDCAETYKSGFLVGKRQGAIELLREILGIDVDDPPKEVE